MQIPQRREDKLKVRDESPIPLTEAGLARLREKLARVKASIPELANEAKRTADYGDRSENAEYQAAKAKLRGAHRQILTLEDQIKRAVVIRSGPGAAGRIQLGSTVVLESGGQRMTFEIVGPQETDPDRGRISHESPLGAALIGHGKGDTVSVRAGKGSREYRVLEIK